jgi:DNA-directed RNA polymerase subunit alpha
MFQRPRRIEWEALTPRFGRMIAEPFEKGYALTVGNSLRRVLLSVLPGAAIVWAKLDGASGDQLPGVQEDVTTILMNLKKVVVRLPGDRAATVRLDLRGPRVVTAKDLAASDVQVIDGDVPVATIKPGGRLGLEVGVQMGRGYVSADRQPGGGSPGGAIALDAAFCPVQRVSYTVEMSRLGKITDYEKLVVEVATNGTITPDQALLRSSALLRDHFDLFTPAGAEEEDDEPSAQPAASRADAARTS